MKRRIGILLLALVAICITIGCRHLLFDNRIAKVDAAYKETFVQEVVDYPEAVKRDAGVNLTYPRNKVAYAYVEFDDLLNFRFKLLDSQLETILKVLNDSSSYQWGEIGTPHFDRTIYFYNHENEVIGVTLFSYDHQTYSHPHTALMKWGMLKDEAFLKLLPIVNGK